MNYDRPFLIAITGGIASGKSLVSHWFEDHDFLVYYSDKMAHDILEKQTVIEQLQEIFSSGIVANNKIDRVALGKIIFNDANKREQLNSIIHPLVRAERRDIIMLSDAKYLVFEIPLLFENGLQNAFDLTINISAPDNLRIKRILKRDGISEGAARKRIEAQMAEFDKQKLADINIANTGAVAELFRTLERLWPLMKKLKKKDVKDQMVR